MPNNESKNSYNFVWLGGERNIYAFTTVDEIGYEIRFVPSSYMFDSYIEHHVDAYEMVIAVADNPLGRVSLQTR